MNFMSINIRGIGGIDKPAWISKLTREHKISFLCMQETQTSNLDPVTVGRFWGKVDMEWDFVDARGRSGGIVSAWDPGIFSKQGEIKNESFLVVTGRIAGSDIILNIVNVYAPCDVMRRRELWDELKRIKVSKEGLWILIGDFNEVREEGDRMVSRFDSHGATIFNSFIAEAGLLEYQMGGGV
ncbi:putative AP endonuclease 1, Endonuclease/exonuclease/phosphatase superfamily [Helianthus annuus]|nr:putative AP endonuclease 1, Endonuclease/exonuclease/phosphatase superfamily [Helianthus annuus]